MKQSVSVGGISTQFDQSGEPNAPVVILSHHLGTNLEIWEPQLQPLGKSFRVVRYDIRGHGGTSVTDGPYTIDMLAEDVISLMDALGIERAHFAGASLGGFIGQWLGASASGRIDRLVLINTAPRIGPRSGWDARIADVRANGMEAVVDASIDRWFTPGFVKRAPAVVQSLRSMLRQTSVEGYTGCCAAIRDLDLRSLAPAIATPTLVIAGMADVATPPGESEWLARHIPNARCLTLPAAHMANLEAATDTTAAIIEFLSKGEV